MNESTDPECALAFAYAPARAKASLLSLWRLDASLARIAASTREPGLTAIKLAWWRDALVALDDAPPPAEPMLREAATSLLPAGIRGAELAAMAEGWIDALTSGEGPSQLAYAAARGRRLFWLAARVLGGNADETVLVAGEIWGLVDHAQKIGAGDVAEAALSLARAKVAGSKRRWPIPLRPIGMLAALARADSSRPAGRMPRQGGPSRLLRMALHRLSGS